MRVILEIENSIRKKEPYPLYSIFSHNYNYYDGPWYKTAHQSIAYSAKEVHPELKKDAERLIKYTFNSKASGVIEFLKGITDPLMIASAGLARLTTAKVIGTIFGTGAKGLKVTVASIGVESAGFVLYDKALREALTNDNVDWGAGSTAKGWADLSLRFAFAHAITKPLSSVRGVMAKSSLWEKR